MMCLLALALSSSRASAAMGGGPVMAGADVVAYFSLPPDGKGIIAPDNRYAQTYGGYEFWFASKENSMAFAQNPTKYMPAWGGF